MAICLGDLLRRLKNESRNHEGMKYMGKLMRRAELQDKYGWEKHPKPLPWVTVRDVAVKVSDYARQETILEWIVDNNWGF